MHKHVLVVHFILLTMVLLLGVVLFNVAMDPYSIFHEKKTLKPLSLINKSYLTKAIELTYVKTNTLLIGSSIVDAGFKLPGSMTILYDRQYKIKNNHLENKIKQDLPIYNAGIRGGGIIDIFNYIKFAYQNNPELNHIILGLPWGPFTYARFAERQMPTRDALHNRYSIYWFYGKKMLTWEHLADSFLILTNENPFFKKLTAKYKHLQDVDKRLQQKALKRVQYDPDAYTTLWKRLSKQTYGKPIYKQLIKGHQPNETAAFLFSLVAISGIDQLVKTHGKVAAINPVAMDTLREIVAFARTHHIKLDVYISPQHGTYWQTAAQFDLESYIDEWMRAFAAITPFWDFSGRIDFNKNVNHYFNSDALHFNDAAGEIILPAILRHAEDPARGVHFVTNRSVEALIQYRHQRRAAWLQHNEYLQEMFSHSIFNVAKQLNGSALRIYLMNIHPAYLNHQILQFMGQFIALKPTQTPYDLKALLVQQDRALIKAETLDQLLKKIKDSHTFT